MWNGGVPFEDWLRWRGSSYRANPYEEQGVAAAVIG